MSSTPAADRGALITTLFLLKIPGQFSTRGSYRPLPLWVHCFSQGRIYSLQRDGHVCLQDATIRTIRIERLHPGPHAQSCSL